MWLHIWDQAPNIHTDDTALTLILRLESGRRTCQTVASPPSPSACLPHPVQQSLSTCAGLNTVQHFTQPCILRRFHCLLVLILCWVEHKPVFQTALS